MTTKMKKIYKKLAVLLFLLVGACNLDGDLQNPNEVSVAGADVNLIMNAIQLDFGDLYYTASTTVDPLVRGMFAMAGGFRYQTANQPQGNDGLWIQSYQNVLVNAELMIPLATAKGLTTHIAAAEIMEAYTYMMLVDIFGDVPQSEALQGPAGNFNPKADGGASVYAKALSLLDDARVQLAKTGANVGGALTRDIYYGGSRTLWNALANTLELRMQMNLGTAAANARIAVLIDATKTDIIDKADGSENFTYKYGIATVPDSRHPLYNTHYQPTKGAAGGYLSNYFMHEAYGIWNTTSPTDYTLVIEDPRWRYYFYRQVGSIKQMNAVDPKAVGCTPGSNPNHYISGPGPTDVTGVSATGSVFCIFDPGFYGRDHGDASGTPPSGPVQTVAGVYPAGGTFDNTAISDQSSYFGSTIRGDGANGAGINPIWMSFYTDFLKAEYYSKTGNAALAKSSMDAGIANSVAQVKAFAVAKGAKNTIQSTAKQASVLAAYAANADLRLSVATKPLDVIGREFFIAAWGNGLEQYNLYRRTSAPRNLQPTLQIGPGPWLRTQVYPSVYVNLNQNAAQKDANATVKTFWDTNPDVLN